MRSRAPDAGRERETAGERLAQADQIGHDAAVFAGKPFPGAAEAGVNFIENQQRAVLVAQFAQQRQKFRRRDIDAAARLHRLDQNRADPFAAEKVADRTIRRRQVSAGSSLGNGTKWPNSRSCEWNGLAEKIAVRGVERAVAEPVIRAGKGDDAALAGGQHRGLERGLDGFKTGVAENDFAGFEFRILSSWLCQSSSARR